VALWHCSLITLHLIATMNSKHYYFSDAHCQEEKKLKKDAQVTTWFKANLSTKTHMNIFFGCKISHLCEFKNVKMLSIKELATLIFPKSNL
jgi:hypothetical protein